MACQWSKDECVCSWHTMHSCFMSQLHVCPWHTAFIHRIWGFKCTFEVSFDFWWHIRSTVLLIHCSNTEIWFLATDYNAQLGRESWTTHTIHQWWVQQVPSTSMTCEVLVSALLKCLLSDHWLVCTAGRYLVYHTAVTPPSWLPRRHIYSTYICKHCMTLHLLEISYVSATAEVTPPECLRAE